VVFYDNMDAGRSQVRFAFCKKQHVHGEALSRWRGLARRGRPGD
jgi:N-succinyldiaminopimelate aminotransferase